jgi:DNA-directed RNA polymerase specialized sigma24 family protein
MEFVEVEDREILILKHWKNLDNIEIGKQLGITPNAARMRIERATGRLAKKIGALRRGMVPEVP